MLPIYTTVVFTKLLEENEICIFIPIVVFILWSSLNGKLKADFFFTKEYRSNLKENNNHCFIRVLFGEILQTNKFYMREVTVIKPEWLTELAPHFYQRTAIDQT